MLLFATLISQAATWHVDPILGTDDISHGTGTGVNAFKTIQYAINFGTVATGDVIKLAAGTYTESNIVVDKPLTIQGTGATRDAVVIVSTGVDANVDNAFGSGALNGFIIKSHDVTIRKLTINGNPTLTPGVYNFRAGIVSWDPGQVPGGGVWNNLHVDNVSIKYAWRRGVSIFPRTVSGTVIENSNVEYIAYNQAIYLAGHGLALNNTVKHCFQGIVLNPDITTPTGLFKVNGNVLSEIGNYPGCYGYPNFQPRAIEFNAVDSTFRTVEIRNNTINDNTYTGAAGTVGIYTRRANAASLVENNIITLGSGSSFSVPGGTQSVGMILGWSYGRAFTARQNQVITTGYGIGIMLVDVGSVAKPMILEGNVLSSFLSAHLDLGDGAGIYISNEYLYSPVLDKSECYVKIQNHNSISGFVNGIDVEKMATSTLPLTVFVHNNRIFDNTAAGIEASTLTSPIDATNNWWGNCSGPYHSTNPGGTCNAVTNNVSFMPWWCDVLMTTAGPALTPGYAILNTTTGAPYTSAELYTALAAALNGETLYVAPGSVDGTIDYYFPGKTVYIVGSGVPGQSVLDGTLTVSSGNLIIQNGVAFTNSTDSPTIIVDGGNLTLRNCIINETTGGDQACLEVTSGTVDAGTADDNGLNQFVVNSPGSAVNNVQLADLWAIGNDWGAASGPYIASTNPGGTGGAIIGAGADDVIYSLFAGGPITTVTSVFVCAGVPTVDIPVTVSNFNNVGKISLTFGFTPAQMINPVIVYTDPAFSSWPAFTVTTDPLLLAAGIFKVSGYGPLPGDGVTLVGANPILLTLRFDIQPNVRTNSTAPLFLNENPQGTACEYGGVAPSFHPFNDVPTSTYYINGGVTLNQHRKISGVFTYYNAANVILTGADITINLYKSSDVTHSTLLGTTMTNGSGYYEFDDLCPDESYDLLATSTHTTDGSVNTTDAAQVNYWPIAPYSIEKVRFFAGDVGTFAPYVQQDWYLSSTDAQRIQQNFVNGKAFDRPWTFWRTGQFIATNPLTPTPSYPFVNLSTSGDATVNMYGLCTGDFNRSFNPLLTKKAPSKNLDLIYGRSMLATSGQEFDLPIHLVNASTIGAVSLILNFPAELAEIKDVLVNGAGGQLDWAVKGNELRIGWNSLTPADLAAYDNLVTLRLKTTDAFTKWASIRLTLAADPLNELANNAYEVIGDAIISVDVVEASPNGIFDPSAGEGINIHNYPNPFANSTTISYTLPFNGNVILEIRNSMGETVKILTNEMQTTGDHSLKFDASSLSPGVYTATVKLSNNNNAVNRTIKLVISK